MPIIAMDYGIVIQTMHVFTLFAIWKHKLNEEVWRYQRDNQNP